MSILSKAANFFGLADEEYEFDGYATTEQPVVQQAVLQKQPVSATPRYQEKAETVKKEVPRTVIRKQTQQTKPVQQPQSKPVVHEEKKVVSLHQPQANVQATRPSRKQNEVKQSQAGKITIIEPRVYSEAMNIAKHILNNESVLVNFHLVEEEQARRIVDFLTGTVYAQDGDIKRVGDEIFLCTPKGVEIDGAAQNLVDTNLFDL